MATRNPRPLQPKRRVQPPGRRSKEVKGIQRLIESQLIRRLPFDHYRHRVRQVYDGPQGAFLATASLLSLHSPLSERWLRVREFDLRGQKHILDIGSGAGQIIQHLLKYADADATIVGVDLSHAMLRRARTRLKSARPRLSVADMTRLPMDDNAFDVVTCGYVLEHLPNARVGLAELARVMRPGGRLLLLTTEDSLSGAWTSRLWHCRTYSRAEVYTACDSVGLKLKKELWFSNLHKSFRAGGICVELEKQA
ncbi:MAG: class I SAM-dependent methyltransferase [Pirellulales bacterium]|nr:class I SAM-dependent methyltransferase [Pirellulales bacterium]